MSSVTSGDVENRAQRRAPARAASPPQAHTRYSAKKPKAPAPLLRPRQKLTATCQAAYPAFGAGAEAGQLKSSAGAGGAAGGEGDEPKSEEQTATSPTWARKQAARDAGPGDPKAMSGRRQKSTNYLAQGHTEKRKAP